MEQTVLFVHGTGVRERRFRTLFAAVAENLGDHFDVQPCYWGGEFGVRFSEGRSIPDYKEASSVTPVEQAAWEDESRWAILEFDPLYEIRVLGLRAGDVVDLQPGDPGHDLRRDLNLLRETPALLDLLQATGYAPFWDKARSDLLHAQEFERAMAVAEPDAIHERQACARALVALMGHRAGGKGVPAPSEEDRQAIVDELIRMLGADVAGKAADLFAKAATVVLGGTALSMAPAATWVAARQRGAVADATAPMAGDILLYQVRGQAIRDYITTQIQDIGGPVTLLAHSLGGIACVDVLAKRLLPNVRRLITVGSQAPFLHELGALWSLERDESLPDHFPSWINVYDKKDLLSFVGERVFGDVVSDIEVDNHCSFPRSHSQYWSNPRFWTTLREAVL